MDLNNISLLIPVTNNEFILELLDTYTKYNFNEIIILDNSNSLPESISKYPIKVLKTKNKLNAALARNTLSESVSESSTHLLFCDDDTLINQASLQLIEQNNGEDVICGNYDNPQDAPLFSNISNKIDDYRRSQATDHDNIFSSSHFLIKKDIFKKFCGFDQTISSYEDMEFFYRLKVFNIRVKYIENFSATHLKRYDFTSLIADYYKKSGYSLYVRHKYSPLFKNVDQYTGGVLPLLWIVNFFLIIAGLSGFLLSLPCLFMINLLFPYKLHKEFSFKERFFFSIINPFISCAVIFSSLKYKILNIASSIGYYLRVMQTLISGLFRVLLLTKPIQILYTINSKCDLRCQHCYLLNEFEQKIEDTPAKQLKKAMTGVDKILWFGIAGGEPYLHEDLNEIVKSINESATPLITTLSTNGKKPEKILKKTIEILRENNFKNFYVTISLDGPPDVHDSIRGKDSYKNAIETFDLLKTLESIYKNFSVHITFTVTPQNRLHIKDFTQYLTQTFDINRIGVNIFRLRDKNYRPSPEILQAYNDCINILEKERDKRYKLSIGLPFRAKDTIQKRIISRISNNETVNLPCHSGELSYFIQADGNVVPCEMLNTKIGNTKTQSLLEIISSSKAIDLRRKIKKESCQCTWECAVTTNVLRSSLFYKEIVNEIFKAI